MTPAFSARRRADEFEALVSRRLDGHAGEPGGADRGEPVDERTRERYGDLLALVGDLRAVPAPSPRADFVADLRERLMTEADTVLVPAATTTLATQQKLALPPRSRDRRFAVALGSAALVGATATVAVASQTALPGESLYPVKRGIEATEHRLAPDEATLGRSLLASAERRLTEVESLAAEDGAGADGAARAGAETLIPETLNVFGEQSEDGARSLLDAYDETGDSAAVEDLRAFTARSMDRLEVLEPSLPDSARDELLTAGRRLSDLDAAAAVACRVCTGGITETPAFLVDASASPDLLAGLDRDEVRLDPAPVSGQDVTGVEVPDALQVPTDQVTDGPLPEQDQGTPQGTGSTGGDKTKGSGQGSVKDKAEDTVKDTTDLVDDVVTDTTDTLTETTDTLTDTITGTVDEVTGGAVGGLTGGLDDATGGLIGDVTGTLPTPGIKLP